MAFPFIGGTGFEIPINYYDPVNGKPIHDGSISATTGESHDYSNSGSSLLTDLGSAFNDLSGVSASQQFSALEAQKEREWQEKMSNTAYQRAVADMKAAGLNPASLSSPATSSSGASAYSNDSGGSAVLSLIGKLLTQAITSSRAKNINNFYH